MRFLFVVFADSGHLNPMLALAQHVERAGHDVVLCSLGEDIGTRAAASGLRGRCVTSGVSLLNMQSSESQRSLKMATRLANPAWLRRMNERLLLDNLPGQVEALTTLAAEARPDVLVVDAMAYAGAIVAERRGLPWASLATGLQSLVPDADNDYRAIGAPRDKALAPWNVALRFRHGDVISPWLDAMFTVEDLVPPAMRPSARLVGPAIPLSARGDTQPFAFERLPADRPIVYVAFGSIISHGAAVYEALVSSVEPKEAFFVLALKDLVAEPFVASLPEHAFAAGYAPQLDLLERCSVMVNHGGANSVHECLAHGRPMIVVPLVAEHALVAKLVEEAGVGIAIPPAMMTTARCRQVLEPMLREDAPERRRAAAVRARMGNGAARVAVLLAELAETRAPLT